MFSQNFHESRVIPRTPNNAVNREALDRARHALRLLPNTQLSSDEAIEEIYPELLAALDRGASLTLIRDTLFHQGIPIPDHKWGGLSQRLVADLKNQRSQ